MKPIAGWVTTGCVCVCSFAALADEAESGRPISVSCSHPTQFEVIFHRVNPTGAGGAIGGLIGASVQMGIQTSQDQDMTKKVVTSNPDVICDKPLLDAMTEKLQASGKYAISPIKGQNADEVDIQMRDCALHLVDSATYKMASYVSLSLRVKPAKGEAWSESIQISGRNRHSFDEFAEQAGLAKTEMVEVLQRAGVRAADKIIYRK